MAYGIGVVGVFVGNVPMVSVTMGIVISDLYGGILDVVGLKVGYYYFEVGDYEVSQQIRRVYVRRNERCIVRVPTSI